MQRVGVDTRVRMLIYFHTLEVNILELVFNIDKIGKNASLLTKQYDPQHMPLSLIL